MDCVRCVLIFFEFAICDCNLELFAMHLVISTCDSRVSSGFAIGQYMALRRTRLESKVVV